MKTLNVLFIGADIQVLSRIESALLGRVLIDTKNNIELSFKSNYYDCLIVDCRKKIPDMTAALIPALALIKLCKHQRDIVYSKGFSDYLAWPLIDQEIRQRLSSIRNPSANRNQSPLVSKACQYLTENISDNRRLSSLCQHIGTNPTTLTREFKNTFSTTPISWLRRQRLLYAADYLAETQMPITEIAMKLGYQDSNNFSTTFRKHYGMSPRQYRKNNSIIQRF